jgi:hypothetical protein
MPNKEQIKALAEQHETPDGCWDAPYGFKEEGLIAFAQAIERIAREAAIRDLYGVIDNDAYAMSFQTMGQYRTALRSAIRALPTEGHADAN